MPIDKDNDKLVASQTMATDLVAEVSAMINQDNMDKGQLHQLHDRLQELATNLNELSTRKVDF